jgi:hypothetical protein
LALGTTNSERPREHTTDHEPDDTRESRDHFIPFDRLSPP